MQTDRPIFLFLKRKPRSFQIYASDEVRPIGEFGRKLNEEHPRFDLALNVVSAVLKFVHHEYGGKPASLRDIAEGVQKTFGPELGAELLYIPSNPTTPERVLVRPVTVH